MNNKFNWRTFISFSLFLNLFLILITGLVLYLKPTGQDATWIRWRLLGLSKSDWEALHTIPSYAFVIFAFAHLFFINWKAFGIYLSEKYKSKMKRSKELIAAITIITTLSIGTILEIPPFKNIMNLGSTLSNSWIDSNNRAPFPRAERYSLNEIINNLNGTNSSEVKRKFQMANVHYKSFNQSLSEIAELNDCSPAEIYLIMIR